MGSSIITHGVPCMRYELMDGYTKLMGRMPVDWNEERSYCCGKMWVR